MNKTIILIALFVLTQSETIKIGTVCTCTKMSTQSDCGRIIGCTWDQSKKSCIIIDTPTKLPDTSTYATYCDQFNTAVDCPKKASCAWDGKTCTHFTACTSFVYDEDAKCQAVSTRCITDGVRCIEKAGCSTYKNSKSCVLNDKERYCYWNTSDPANFKCEDTDDCTKLPSTLTSDALCRAQISICTAKEGGGCIEIGVRCEDQISEIGCVKDKSGAVCFWSKGKCLDKICDNAPTDIVTDQACKQFISTCTTKQGGGCITRSSCGSAGIQAACVINNLGEECFWNGTICVDKTCANAVTSNKTNQSCQQYLKKCITTGSGCTDNTGCSAATIKDACDKTLTGSLCHWNGSTCKNKTCENADSSYIGHEQCTTYMASCTAKSGATSGCEDRRCINAPQTYTSNEQCEAYLPNQKCVTKEGGGCRINTTCEAIANVEAACKTDENGKTCFWEKGKCLSKICTNSPTSNNNHSLCNSFLSTCTVGSGQTCVDKTCENIQEEANCTTDLNNKGCIYKGKCYQKQCVLASKNYTTYTQCSEYLSTCTIDNSGFGCMDLPIKCEAITQAEGCQITKGGRKCGMLGKNCVDQSCLTALSTIYTTSAGCNIYKLGCVVDNDGTGCIDLPVTCSARKLEDNCEIEQTRSLTPYKCQWDKFTNTVNPVCIDIKCENAHLVTLKNGVTQSGCWSYNDLKCVINTTNDNCIPRPKACVGLGEHACKQTGLIFVSDSENKDCYWDEKSQSCRDIACANITLLLYSHYNCKSAISTCTVNETATQCQDIVACDKYTDSGQCYVDPNQNVCVWNTICKDKPCEDVEDSTNYDNDSECQTYSKKCTFTQQKCNLKQQTCAAIKNQSACEAHTIGRKQQCAWNGTACANTTFDCTKATGTGFTLGYCQYLDSNCTVNSSGTACLTAQASCSGLVEGSCVWTSTDKYCLWNGNACVQLVAATPCSDIAGTTPEICRSKKSKCTWTSGNNCTFECGGFKGPYNYDTCQAYDPQCTVKRDGTGCVNVVATCAATLEANCTHAIEGICYFKDNTCILVNNLTKVTSANCSQITGKGLTVAYCKAISAFNSSCSGNTELTACLQIFGNCAGYSALDCISSFSEQKCTMNADGSQCVAFTGNCATVKFFQAVNTPKIYTDSACLFYGCQANSDRSACEAISTPKCESFIGPVTYEACVGFKDDTCSVNAAKNSCITAKDTCAEYSLENCGYAKNEGECIVLSGSCIQKNCESIDSSISTLAECQTISTNCVVRTGGCQFRTTCSSYTVQGACIKNASGSDCLWNPTAGKCVDKSCATAEASTNFDSHNDCVALGKCTVKATQQKTIGQGCIPFGACISYTIEEQCKKNIKLEDCVWNKNNDPATCADKSCATALNASYYNHEGCHGYLFGCTVNVIDVNGTLTPQGCIVYKTCSSYIHEEQCKFSSDKDENGVNIECGWDGTVCANKSCSTAQQIFNTPTLCDRYLTGCTVNATDNGCISIPDICEGMTQNQCYDGSVDKSSRKCLWDSTENTCMTKKCEYSPNYASESECNTYLAGCTTDTIKCKTKICEDFQFTTDAQCKAELSHCTSNGIYCVKRGTCNQALTEVGCVTDSNGQECQWIIPNGQDANCINKSCKTAPTSLITETQCISYFTPSVGTCTTKKGGGCTLKGTCTAADVAAACTTDNNKNECQWDFDTNTCRLKECKDFAGLTFAGCKKQRPGCTAGLNGKCANITNCQDIKVRAACIEGIDGPCLWIAKFVNPDTTLGACFSYESCKSLDWTTDSSCKQISPNCTTNGTQCIGITSCASTNVQGGCYTGTDGKCIQTVSEKGTTDKICKKFTQCSDAYYLSHEECNSANINCTSDYSTGCIPLDVCQTYTSKQCHKNKFGIQRDSSGNITSTGICVWDDSNKLCKDQQCTDLTFPTEQECSSKLKTCTSDGIKCLVKGTCNSYTKLTTCNFAGGTEGACFWVNATGTCRSKVCSDILNGITTTACLGVFNCVSDGTTCIARANCSTYNTKIACNSKGSDGICVWTETLSGGTTKGKCSLMTSCASAGTDVNACTQANDRCQMDSKTKVCADHTCISYAAQVLGCRYFYTWDYKNYNICQIVDGVCAATNIDSLMEKDCYLMTGYLYSWNPQNSKCTQCETVNNTVNKTNTINNANTDSNYILGFTSIFFGLLMSS